MQPERVFPFIRLIEPRPQFITNSGELVLIACTHTAAAVEWSFFWKTTGGESLFTLPAFYAGKI